MGKVILLTPKTKTLEGKFPQIGKQINQTLRSPYLSKIFLKKQLTNLKKINISMTLALIYTLVMYIYIYIF